MSTAVDENAVPSVAQLKVAELVKEERKEDGQTVQALWFWGVQAELGEEQGPVLLWKIATEMIEVRNRVGTSLFVQLEAFVSEDQPLKG